MINHRSPHLGIVIIALCCEIALAQGTKLVQDFETPADLRPWEFKKKSASLSDQHVTHGKSSLKIAPDEYMVTFRPPRDWSGFDAMEIDVFVEGDAPVGGTLLVGDADWQQKGGSYWNRHNGSFNLKPGANTLSIPVQGLYRGEAGSRNNDLKYNIKPDQIVRLDIGFKPRGGNVSAIYLDHMRLTKESRPDGILAFDFGPENQSVFPGFTAVGPGTVYGKNGTRAGLKQAVGVNSARDDTFPTRLFRDFVMMDWNSFIVDVPDAGTYHAWVVYDDLGYWGGEQAAFTSRKILANGLPGFAEDRGAAGPSDCLFAFETVEPKPADSMWDLYMSRLFAPKRFTCKPQNGKIELRFMAEGVLGCKVAAIVLYPDAIKEQAQCWLAEVEKRNRDEFDTRAVSLGPKSKPLNVPPEAQANGYWLGFPGLDEEVTFADAPGPSDRPLRRFAARGQRVSFTFAVRPLKDLSGGPVTLTASDLMAEGNATIVSKNVELRYVHHSTRRGFNDIAYTIAPESLRLVAGSKLRLEKDLTRQFWVTLSVPPDAAPGAYRFTVTLVGGDVKVNVPVIAEVLPISLDEPDFVMGFFGAAVPKQILQQRPDAWRQLLVIMRESGMNSFSGGPAVRFSGIDGLGKPILDFAACDAFMKLAREVGYSKPLVAYGGPGMVQGLHDGYVIGETGRSWEKKTGKSIGELIGIVWSAVRDHAQKENWLPVLYEFCDEPRVLEAAREQVELMKLYRQHAPWVNIGGSYSVKWDNSPLEIAIQEIFKTLQWSSLNLHTQTDLDKARELGKQLHIYNQGRSRYSFGAYQFAEHAKGIAGRMQWHLLALHGYQFFDLDGREPDTAMINWTSDGIAPTIHLARCREGADDFRFAMTLQNLAKKNASAPAAKEALAWLEQINRRIGLNQNKRPEGFMDDETFRDECVRRIVALTKGAKP